jgi:hypothetical protein
MPAMLTAPQFAAPQGDFVSDETIAMIRAQLADTTRAVTTSTGLIGYELEAPAKTIYPVMTPLVNMVPRRHGGGNDVCHWKAITSFDTGRLWGTVDGNNIGSSVTPQVASMSNTYQMIALNNSVDFKAQFRGRSLEGDVRSVVMSQLLYQLKIVEERWILNASALLMVPPAPLVTQTSATSGHAADSTTYYVAVTAIDSQGTPGETTMSARTAYTTPANSGAGTGNLVITVFTVPNAYAYNVYVGTTDARTSLWVQSSISGHSNAAQPSYNTAVSLSGGGSVPCGEVQAPTLVLTLTATIATSGTNPPSTNNGQTFVDAGSNNIMWDGIIAQALNNTGTGNGLTLGAQASQPAASTGILALSDVDNMLLSMLNQASADPDFLVMNPITHVKLTNLVMAANAFRYVAEAVHSADEGNLTANFRVTHYENKATGKVMPIIPNRYCPADTLIALPMSVPYPTPEVTNAIEIETNQEYLGMDFAITNYSYSFADLVDETLKVYFLGGLGVIRGILPAA